MRFRGLLIAATAVVIGGCFAGTNLTGFKDPDYRTRTVTNVAVFLDMPDLFWRKDIEDCVAAELTAEGIAAQPMNALASPTRPLDNADRLSLLRQRDIGGLVLITVPQQGGGGWKPWFKAHTQVIDVRTGAEVWTADSRSGGNVFAGFADVRESFGDELVDQLVEDRVVGP